MKTLSFIILFIIFLPCSQAQEITMFVGRNLWHADSLCDVDLTGCDWRLLNQGSILGYAYHPNGDLWLLLDENRDPSGDYQNIKIFKVEWESCNYTLLNTIPMEKYWSCVGGTANIDYLGRVYFSLTRYDTIQNKSIKTLTRISDIYHPVFDHVLAFKPQQKTFEVHFTKDRRYLLEIDKPYIRVYDTNFILLDTIITMKHIGGLTSFSYGCDSVITYATHLDISTEEFVTQSPDSIMYISRYDLVSNTLTPVCSFNTGGRHGFAFLTSPLEFLSSDPECDLLIDLDRDNSTGVYPYDYRDSTDYCSSLLAPICDPDVYIHTSAPMDSIILILSGIREPGNEHLISAGLPSGVMFTQSNDSTYMLTSINPTDDTYKAALLAIRYQHDGLLRTAGTRSITLQGFNAIKDGVKIKATIHISGLPYAGADATLLICTDTLIQQLSAITGGQPGGYWWPTLSTGSDIFDSKEDAAPEYHYIVMDPVCGHDTAVVSIIRDGSDPVDLLGDDQMLCPGDTIDVLIQQNTTNILWDDGTNATSRTLTMPGEYSVAVETPGGCIYRDSIHITAGSVWTPHIEATDPTCGQPNGLLAIDPLVFGQNGPVLINGVPMVSPEWSMLPQGIYQITTISNDGCASESLVILTDQPWLDISMDTQVLVTQGLWKTIEYNAQNSVPAVDVLLAPTTSIRWTGTAIEVYGDQDITYEITFVDDNGCTDIHTLDVKVEKEKGIYLPNIFNPASNSGNDVWKPSISESYNLEVLRIYDRWGTMIHQSTAEATWDGSRNGKECQTGVYIYQLILKHSFSGERKVLMGDVTLLR